MSDLGQLLKKARAQKGYTLDELQETTKIRKRYLEAIEEGNYKVLPGNFYVRAFIKSYAEAVGLEPDEVLRLFRSDIPVVHTEPVIEPIRKRSKPGRHSDKLSRWASALLVVAFPLFIIGVIYFYFVWNTDTPDNSVNDSPPLTTSMNEPDKSPAADVKTESPQVVVPDPEPVAPQPELSLVKSEGITDYYTLSHAEQLVVQVNVTGDQCWMAVRKDSANGEVVNKSLTLNNGDLQEWKFDGSAWFHFGRVNAINVKVNGQEINLGDSANPRKVQIDLLPQA